MDRKLKLGVMLGIMAFLVAIGGYKLLISGKDTPNYAIQTVEKAVENHNKADFYKVVNLESILDESYSSIVEGVTDADQTMTEDAKLAVKNFTEMLREPLLLSLKAAIDSYIETGNFNKEENASIKTLLERTGLDQFEYRNVATVSINPKNSNEAAAGVIVYQKELAQEIIFNVILRRNSEDNWQIVSVKNFQEFIEQLNAYRRQKIDEYLEQTENINRIHDAIIEDAKEKYAEILAQGTLGQDNIRADLKTLMLETFKKDWEERKQEFSNLEVPYGAKTLHNLRIKICDLEIGYAEDYAQWMTDKKAATAKSAEDKKSQAKTLRVEENTLYNRMINKELPYEN